MKEYLSTISGFSRSNLFTTLCILANNLTAVTSAPLLGTPGSELPVYIHTLLTMYNFRLGSSIASSARVAVDSGVIEENYADVCARMMSTHINLATEVGLGSSFTIPNAMFYYKLLLSSEIIGDAKQEIMEKVVDLQIANDISWIMGAEKAQPRIGLLSMVHQIKNSILELHSIRNVPPNKERFIPCALALSAGRILAEYFLKFCISNETAGNQAIDAEMQLYIIVGLELALAQPNANEKETLERFATHIIAHLANSSLPKELVDRLSGGYTRLLSKVAHLKNE